ncbi:zinc metallochaperone AztD [Actinomycetes bacterium KLBMP 9759]
MKALHTRRRRTSVVATAVAAVSLLGACGTGSGQQGPPPAPAAAVDQPVVVTHDGGLTVLDGTNLKVAAELPLAGFNRVNAAGDDRHVIVSTAAGFQVLDAVAARLTDITFPGAKPGHVVRHAGKTVLFTDGTGEVTVFDPRTLGDGPPQTTRYTAAEPHHGVAVELVDGTLVTTLGNAETRRGILVLDRNRTEIARNEECPGVHGEAAAQGEAVVVGCENGVLIYRDGTITKVVSPTPYGRIGNQSGSDTSPITLGDYKQDENAELERPTTISLVDTVTAGVKLVDIGTSYTFRSLARGPQAEGLVLGTDGQIHVIDPVAGTVVRRIPVIGAWQEPLEWQQPRPAIFVRGSTAYVSDPAQKQLHAVDLATGAKTATATLRVAPNELSGVTG